MRRVAILILCLAASLPVMAQGTARVHDIRYQVEMDQERFPQKKPADALKSVVKTMGEKRYAYLLAQLSLPAQVDARVLRLTERYSKGTLDDKKLLAFEDLIALTADYMLKDPVLLKELRLFAADPVFEEKDGKAIATHKDLPGRKVIFHQIEGRWFLDNQQK